MKRKGKRCALAAIFQATDRFSRNMAILASTKRRASSFVEVH